MIPARWWHSKIPSSILFGRRWSPHKPEDIHHRPCQPHAEHLAVIGILVPHTCAFSWHPDPVISHAKKPLGPEHQYNFTAAIAQLRGCL